MYSGKSTALINHYTSNNIPSKIYVKFTLKELQHPTKQTIINHAKNTHVIGYLANGLNQILPLTKNVTHLYLDEVHFLNDWEQWQNLTTNKVIYCAGLNMDSNGLPFEQVGTLMCMATSIQKFNGRCAENCKTEFSLSLIEKKNRFLEDTGYEYIPVCRQCFYQGSPNENCLKAHKEYKT